MRSRRWRDLNDTEGVRAFFVHCELSFSLDDHSFGHIVRFSLLHNGFYLIAALSIKYRRDVMITEYLSCEWQQSYLSKRSCI